jgi:geranylgeranyl reductase family protein
MRRLVDADVLVVGAGPAGAIAAMVLARAGARVRILDRATFPRDKLCGDTVNPGTLSMLRRLNVATEIEASGLKIRGMRVTGERGEDIEGSYPHGLYGVSLSRREFDWALLGHAMKAGAAFEENVTVRDAIIRDDRGTSTVCGVKATSKGTALAFNAPVVIAADGRRSALAFGLGLAAHAARPRRWAVGAYYETAREAGSLGEMHIRSGWYVGVAPLPGGLTNVCLVRPSDGARHGRFANPTAMLMDTIAAEPFLHHRFGGLEPVRPPVVLGPLGVDTTGRFIHGLLVAGDAAGFVDPMTGDGLRFAIRGGELAGEAALRALLHGWEGVHADLRAARRREFGAKWRFNRGLRALVTSSAAVHGARLAVRVAPGLIRALVGWAGDCDLARSRPTMRAA